MKSHSRHFQSFHAAVTHESPSAEKLASEITTPKLAPRRNQHQHHHHSHHHHSLTTMIRRQPTSLSVQESDVETLKAYRRAKMMQHNPNLTASSFSSIRPDESGSTHHDHQHHYGHQYNDGRGQENQEQEDPGTQPGLSQQENHNPNQSQNANT